MVFIQHLRLQLIFFKILLFGGFLNDRKEGWAFKKLFTCHTFRVVGNNPESDFLAFFRYFKRSLGWILLQNQGDVYTDFTCVYIHKEKQRLVVQEYLEFVLSRTVQGVICRDSIRVFMPYWWRLLMVFQLFLMAPFFFVVVLFSKRKSSVALIMLQWVENCFVSIYCRIKDVKSIYLFGGYENDQCITGLFFRAVGIKLTVVPSPNPIKNFYRQMVAHSFVFTSPFQKVEFEDVRGEWQVEDLISWPIPEAKKLFPYILKEPPKRRSLAFMSRGVWLRKLRGLHAQEGSRDFDYEEGCMAVLRDFLNENKSISLLILPHPMERANEGYWRQAQDYYSAYFSGIEILYPQDANVKSFQMFGAAELALASISSVNIERLFCGYKTLYAPIGAEHQFFSGSTLDNIVARTPERLMQLLKESMQLNENEFFEQYKLTEYRYSSI